MIIKLGKEKKYEETNLFASYDHNSDHLSRKPIVW
jgi:hypothetical protein